MRLTTVVLSAAALLLADHAPALAVECGDTVTASVTLDHDLVDCPGVGIVIGADDVTIDLAGHTIDGNEGPDDAIRTVTDRKNIAIKGPGVITGFDDGVVVGGANLKVLGVTFRDLADEAINVGPSPGSLIVGNVFRNVGSAIDFSAGNGKVLVKGNVVAHARVGIFVAGAVGAAIVDNLVADVSGSVGIFVEGPNAVVKGNRVARAADVGILLSDVTNGKVVANTVTGAGTSGIDLDETQATRVERNVVTGAVSLGVAISDVDSDGNRVRRNVVLGGLGVGIFVAVDATLNTIEGNVVEGNAIDGVRVDQAGTVVKKNRADGNGDVGIAAVVGTVDGGGNRARGNGGPEQCVGVVCP